MHVASGAVDFRSLSAVASLLFTLGAWKNEKINKFRESADIGGRLPLDGRIDAAPAAKIRRPRGLKNLAVGEKSACCPLDIATVIAKRAVSEKLSFVKMGSVASGGKILLEGSSVLCQIVTSRPGDSQKFVWMIKIRRIVFQ